MTARYGKLVTIFAATAIAACTTVTTDEGTLAELQQIVSARIHLLVRTVDIDVTYTNDKTYSIGNADDFTPNDQVRLRGDTTTVGIPNLRNRAMMGI